MEVFFKMRELWFETHKVFLQRYLYHFFHSFPMRAENQDGVHFFFNSVNTRIQFVLNLLLNSVFILEQSSHSLTVLVLLTL